MDISSSPGVVRVSVFSPPAVDLQPVVTGIDRPVAITNAGDGSGRLFITLRAGFVVIVGSQGLNSTPFLDISALTTTDIERGLLSIAFHPSYRTNGFFYVNYTNLNGDTVIARYHVSVNPDVADPGSAAVLLTVPQPFANHNGGQLQVGPDGNLYIGMGDGGSGGDPLNNGQNLGTLLGKILRIDVDGAFPYAVPPNNPFLSTPGARPEIWAYGLRNPWRFSFDRQTGDIFIGDVGQDSFEEVDFQPAASAGGENYGWRLMEATHCFNPASNCNDGSLTLPVMSIRTQPVTARFPGAIGIAEPPRRTCQVSILCGFLHREDMGRYRDRAGGVFKRADRGYGAFDHGLRRG